MRSRGSSLLEVMAAIWLSLGALLAAGPALGLGRKALVHNQASFDQEVALEAAWSEILQGVISPATVIRDIQVAEDRTVSVTLEFLEERDGIRHWRLSVS